MLLCKLEHYRRPLQINSGLEMGGKLRKRSAQVADRARQASGPPKHISNGASNSGFSLVNSALRTRAAGDEHPQLLSAPLAGEIILDQTTRSQLIHTSCNCVCILLSMYSIIIDCVKSVSSSDIN